MKVAYLFSRYPVPSQTFCDTEIRALEHAGLEVEVGSCSPPTTSFRHGAEDRPRARVFYAPPPEALAWWEAAARADGSWPAPMVERHAAAYGARFDPAKRARHAVYFADLLRRRGIDHLHVHFANRATHAALFIRELTGLPFSFTAHAQDFLVDLGSDALLSELCARAEFIVAVSDWSRRALLERCPAATGKIHRIYNGLPLDRWPEPDFAPSPGQTLNIFSVGRLIDFKGFSDLVAACAVLRDRGILRQCSIAGEGPLRDTLQRQITASGLDPLVRLTGLLTQEQVRARMHRCDVFALPCCVDAKGACDVLPTVILEAMAAGRPVVSTRVAAVPEMVADGRTGLLVAPRDPVALADALTHLAAHPERRIAYGRAGREKLVSTFAADGSARQLAALFKSSESGQPTATQRGAAPTDSPGTLCLLDRWPLAADPTANAGHDDPLFAVLARRWPGLRVLALKPGGRLPAVSAAAPAQPFPLSAVVRALEFLPDAFVLESCWRDHPGWANRIESWRSDLGSAGDPDDFQLAARRALYLKCDFAHGPPLRHLHAVGPGSALCAWLLKRLEAVATLSLFLPPAGTPLPARSLVRKIAPAFVGGWMVGEGKLASSSGPNFSSDQPTPEDWRHAIERWDQKS